MSEIKPFKGKPRPEAPEAVGAFLHTDKNHATPYEDVRVAKHCRMRRKFGEMLADRAHALSKREGRRVTEADVLDAILAAEWARLHPPEDGTAE